MGSQKLFSLSGTVILPFASETQKDGYSLCLAEFSNSGVIDRIEQFIYFFPGF